MPNPVEPQIYDVWKVCSCGHRWLGKLLSNTKPLPDQVEIKALCPRCDKINQALIKRTGENRPLSPRKAAPTADQDQPFTGPRLYRKQA